jgi:hypothetical protein
MMSLTWGKISCFGTRIQNARNFLEVAAVWREFQEHLHDFRLIYSHPEESNIVMPSKTWPRAFPKGALLRPLFAHDNLYFMDERIAWENRFGLESGVRIDSTLEFDTNIARYLEGLMEGRKGVNIEKVRQVVDFLVTTEHANFSYNFYSLENASGFYDGSRVSSIRRNLRAILKFDYMDDEHYKATGEVRTVINDQELDRKADEKLHHLYGTKPTDGLMGGFSPTNELLYLILLKTVEIEFGGKKRLAVKMHELYEFMHFELKTIVVREAIIALNYFKKRSGLEFFGKIRPKSRDEVHEIIALLKNMSWDLMLFRLMDRTAAVPGAGDFLIPYFLSCDGKMVKLFDLSPMRGMLICGEYGQVVPIWEEEPLKVIGKDISTKNIEIYLSQTATNVRDLERQADPQPDRTGLKENLEREVTRLLTL